MAAAGAQASFDDLGTHLSQVTFCVVDLETTGGAETDMITEVGAVKVRGGEVLGEFQTLVNPRSMIPPLIAVLTGITNQMVADAPGLRQVLPSFLAFAHGTAIVAHNAPFDVGFLRRACEACEYPFPRWPVVDTAALARQILLADEVANCRLATLARHFRSDVTPNHRALTDAQATVDVLHGLIERVGNLGVQTIEDLAEFSRRVSPQRRAKRTWAADLPERPGVYLFVAEHDQQRHVLYVGKSVNIRTRVRTYFTAAEKRPRIDEMVRLATGVEAVPCLTPLQADVTELRLIGRHAPRYNRRSKFPERVQWIKITEEAFPRLSMVRNGPRRRRHLLRSVQPAAGGRGRRARDLRRIPDPAVHATVESQLRRRAPARWPGWGGAARPATAPSPGTATPRSSSRSGRPSPAMRGRRCRRYAAGCSGWWSSSGSRRRRRSAADWRRWSGSAARFHRVRSLAGCPEIVAARRDGPNWEIHVVRFGRLAGTGVSTPREVPQAVARAVRATAETVIRPPDPLPAAGIEETERIADWLEQPGVRLIEITGDWMWPLHAVVDYQALLKPTLTG